MSFAATLGLVALVQIGMPNLFASPDHSTTARIALWGGREIAMLFMASMIAGLATTPYAAFHFHRVTPYGVLANLGAMPVVSALVMPAGLLGLLAAPFGLDGVFWWLMGIGIDWMIAVSRWVAALRGSIGHVAAFGTGPLIAASLGLVLLGLLRTPLRWSGAFVLVAATIWGLSVRQPDILIAGDGQSVAVRGRDGRLHLMRTNKDNFLIKEWLAADADPRDAASASLSDGVSCDESGCVTPLADGRMIAQALRIDALSDDCSRAALVVTARPAPPDCGAMVLDRPRLARQGALALTPRGDGFAIASVKARGANRPWSPAAAGDGDSNRPSCRGRQLRASGTRHRRKPIFRPRTETDPLADRQTRGRRVALGDDLRLVLALAERLGHGQLQHGCTLSFDELRHQDVFAVGKFDRVVVTIGNVRVDLAEFADARVDGARPDPAIVVADVVGEGELRARQQADRNGHVGLGGEAARRGAAERCRDDRLANLCGTRRDGMQAIVTHRVLLNQDRAPAPLSEAQASIRVEADNVCLVVGKSAAWLRRPQSQYLFQMYWEQSLLPCIRRASQSAASGR